MQYRLAFRDVAHPVHDGLGGFISHLLDSYPTSWMPLTLYFADMALAAFTFHQMYYLIAVERGEKKTFKLSARNIISMVTYTLAAAVGGFCPVVAYIVVAAVTCWWIFPEKAKQ